MLIKHSWLFFQRHFKRNSVLIFSIWLGLVGYYFIAVSEQSFRAKIDTQSKELLSADLTVGARRPLSEVERKELSLVLNNSNSKSVESIEIYSMLRTNTTRSRLVETTAVSDGYPFYGKFDLEVKGSLEANAISHLPKNHIWITREVAQELNLKVGQSISLGKAQFIIDDIINDFSAISWRGVSLAPTVFIHFDDLAGTKLVQKGSTLYNRIFYKTDVDSVKELKDKLTQKLTDPGIRIKFPEDASEQVARVVGYLSDYLGLVSLSALFLSCVGTVFLFRNQISARRREVAMLRVLGVSPAQVQIIFIFQLLGISIIAVLLALMSGEFLFPLSSGILSNALKQDFILTPNINNMLTLAAIGILTTLFCCLPQLYQLSKIKLADLFSEDEHLESINFWSLLIRYLPALVLFYVLSIYIANSVRVGTLFYILFMGVITILSIVMRQVLLYLDRKTSQRPNFNVLNRMGELSLIRGGSRTILSFISIAMGVLLLNLVGVIENGIKNELVLEGDDAPSLFLFDIQEEQVDSLKSFADRNGINISSLSPMVQARPLKINDRDFTRKEKKQYETREDESARRFSNRTVNLTYRSHLSSAETLLDGEHPSSKWDGQGHPCLSIEFRYARRLGIELGDVLTFDILDVPVQGRVCSIRSVKWTSFMPNFFVSFQAGVLEMAPKTFLASVAKHSTLDPYEIQAKLAGEFSNIATINIERIITKVMVVFNQMKLALSSMAIFCLLVGIVVIYSIASEMVSSRAQEFVLMRMVGMSAAQVNHQTVKEFLLVSFYAASSGAVLAPILGWIVSMQFFDGAIAINLFNFFGSIILVPLLCYFLTYLKVRTQSSKKLNTLFSETI